MTNKIKYTDGFWKTFKMKCPCCHKEITFGNNSERYIDEAKDKYGIEVNCIFGGKDYRQFKLEETQAPKTLPQELGTRAGNLGDVSGSATMINNKMNIEINHKDPELTKSIRDLLEGAQAKGYLTFDMKTKRICDFCKKTLADDEDFITLDNGDDKCEECQRKQ